MKKTIPKFKTETEERRFWQQHDSSEYLDWSEAEEIVLPKLKPSTRTISVRLPESMLEELKVLANKRDVPYQSLLKIFLSERIDTELHRAKAKAQYIHRNPLRAGIVKRLIDHKWSSYPVYAYNRKYPEWLKTDVVLSQFGTDNPQLSYRKKVQRYSKEEASLFEELRYGLFFGTSTDNAAYKKHEPEKLLQGLSYVLGCDLESFRESLRILEKDKAARDLMIFFSW